MTPIEQGIVLPALSENVIVVVPAATAVIVIFEPLIVAVAVAGVVFTCVKDPEYPGSVIENCPVCPAAVNAIPDEQLPDPPLGNVTVPPPLPPAPPIGPGMENATGTLTVVPSMSETATVQFAFVPPAALVENENAPLLPLPDADDPVISEHPEADAEYAIDPGALASAIVPVCESVTLPSATLTGVTYIGEMTTLVPPIFVVVLYPDVPPPLYCNESVSEGLTNVALTPTFAPL